MLGDLSVISEIYAFALIVRPRGFCRTGCCHVLPASVNASVAEQQLEQRTPAAQGSLHIGRRGPCHRQPRRRALMSLLPHLPPPPVLSFLPAPLSFPIAEDFFFFKKEREMELLIIKVKSLFHQCLKLWEVIIRVRQ